MNQGLVLAAVAALLAWLASRKAMPEGTVTLGPLQHGPKLAPTQPVPDLEIPFPGLPPGFVPGPIPGSRCPIGGDGSRLCPHSGVMLPYEILRDNPALFSSPSGLSPDAELEALNRYRYPVQ